MIGAPAQVSISVHLVNQLTVRSQIVVSLITTCDVKIGYVYLSQLERILLSFVSTFDSRRP